MLRENLSAKSASHIFLPCPIAQHNERNVYHANL